MDTPTGLNGRLLNQLEDARLLHEKLETLREPLAKVVEATIHSYQNGGKLILFGNGGSAADAQHIAAELLGHFKKERKAFPAIALTTNTSALTAISNDYSFEQVFARQVEAWAQPNDVVIGITTSGTSKNVLAGLYAAREVKALTIGLCGENTKSLQDVCDFVLSVPSKDTPRIQEVHILLGHILCEEVERALAKDNKKLNPKV